MLKRVFFFSLGILLLLVGLVGLLIPVLPGFLFLILAAVCFSSTSPALQRRLKDYPLWRRSQSAIVRSRRRWQASQELGLIDRAQLAFWLSLETMVAVVAPRR